jgi:hypothetical protein
MIIMIMMIFTYTSYNERVSQNLHSVRFHTDQPKRHKYKKISKIIRNMTWSTLKASGKIIARR